MLDRAWSPQKQMDLSDFVSIIVNRIYIFQRTWGAKLFSKIDLMSGFHQILILEEYVHNDADLCQRLMSTVLEEHIHVVYVVVYVDDICIFTKTDGPHEHLVKVRESLGFLATV